jgi:diacylglycerol O-acyltransferase / wax synthase
MALDRLSADDRLILWPDAVWPQDVGALVILDGGSLLDADGGFRIDAARDAVEARLHLLPRFRQVLVEPRRGLGGPLWVDSPGFDTRDHVHVVAVPSPAGEAQLLATVETLRRRRLDRSRPLWEMWFLTGLPGGRVGLFIRLHHVVADGIAGVAAVGALLDVVPDAVHEAPHPWTPTARPTRSSLLLDNVRARFRAGVRVLSALGHPVEHARRVRQGWPALRELLAAEPGPVTSLGRRIGSGRTLALVRTSLADMRSIAHAHEAKINDVLLAATAGGVRRLLLCRKEAVEDLAVPIYVPVSLRLARGGAQEGGNLISQMVVPLPVGEPDPVRRLRQIHTASAARKALHRAPLGGVFRNKLVAGVMLKLVARQRVNIVSADLPGPPVPLYFAGAQVLEVFPLVNLIGTVSLGVAALSYAGTFNIMVVADADAYPDLDVFAAGVRDELAALAATQRSAIGA